MAQDNSAENVHLQQEGGAEDVYSPLRDILEREDENDRKPENILANQLFRALGENDAFGCWKLLEDNHHAIRLEYENFQNNCKEASKKEQQREGRFHCSSKCSEEPKEEQQSSEPQGSQKECINGETKLNWIKVLSNPLFIGLEWLWRTKSNCPCTFCEKDRKLVGKEKKKKEDVIASSLRDAYLLDETSSLKHYNSRDVYRESAEAYETFAAGILEKASQKELHEIMDIKGEGCLLQNDSHQQRNFIESLSLLKSAVNKRRKKFVSSPRCQAILDEIIFYEMRDWQDKSKAKKFFRCLCQFFVVLLVTPLFYVFIRPPMKIWRSLSDIECLAYVEKLYEYPYNKFANHTMFYIVFLCLLFASTFGFEHEYRTSTTGLSSIDYAVLVYFVGFLLQEIWEVCQQGFCTYISKWWNVVDAMTLFTLLAAYTVWLVTWLSVYEEWQPRKNAFIVADVLYASATVLAFFHLAHAFQVSSTLGPLQLSLYRMLKDVAKFLFIFLILFIAFATGLIKIYSYYVVSQVKLREEGESKFQDFHPYAEHEITFIGLVWLLVGYVEEDKIRVDDPAFHLTQLFGRLGFLIYLVCTVIVALNMLIAMMNNSFDRVMGDEDKEWKFSRAQMWLEYIDKGNAIPVPFNLVYYTSFVLIFIIGNLVCCIKTACCGCKCNDKMQASPKPTRAEENVEEGNPQQTSGDSTASCICHGCFCCCKPETENKRKEMQGIPESTKAEVNVEEGNLQQREERTGTVEMQAIPETPTAEVNIEEGNPQQINKEQGSEDQTSVDSTASCIFHGCFCYCKPETENKRKETSCCYWKPKIEYNQGEERREAMTSSVEKYLEQMLTPQHGGR